MRIISQNGEHDFPYEQIGIRNADGVIFAKLLADSRDVLLAMYNSQEEADEILDVMRDDFSDNRTVFQFPEARSW